MASAAKLFLVAVPLSTRLVSETIWFLIGSDQRRPRSTPSSPEQSQPPFRFCTYFTGSNRCRPRSTTSKPAMES
ncbi:hypothetical protein [Lapidilactobacillus wuchangensis]|uniref:hypothetical protein n=1 Tax=Lapidilactobacillus wuchangensis TaxID=2486001 RepID=UPI0013DDFCBD|nr:hypothetical protein [Lapidilactobacillus wuchangensis]